MILALTVAFGLHGLALVSVDMSAGGVASGSGGTASISMAAAAPGLRAIVETWETPPEAIVEVKLPQAPADVAPPKPVGLWDDNPIPSKQAKPLEVPDHRRAPEITVIEATLRRAPAIEAFDKPVSVAKDAVVRQSAAVMPPEETPDIRPEQRTSPESVDRALVASQRPLARRAGTGSDGPVARRVAEGAGGGVTRGQSQDVVVAAAMSPNSTKAAQAAWAAAIQKRIARHQRFPKGGRGTGRVRLTMRIRSDGRMTDVRVAISSGDTAFDRAAVAAAKKAAPFPAAPNGLSDPWYQVGQWVSFGR
jgi:protein TonB